MSDNTIAQQDPIAVIAIGSLYPGAPDIKAYWQTIIEGRDKMQQVPPDYWLSADFFQPEVGTTDRVYTDRGAFIDPIDLDVLDTGVTPNNLSSTDVSQLLALHVAKQLLQDTGFIDDERIKARTSVILGVAGATEMMSTMSARLGEPVWRHTLLESGLPPAQVDELVGRMLDYFPAWQETTFPGLLGNVIAGRVANRLDLHGTNCVVDAACASSFSALSMALNELYLHQSDLVLTGGVDALNHPLMYMCFAQTGALSRTGDCRPFAEQADGTMMGEGIGMLALRRLADAERDGNPIYAVIRGCGASSDGLSKSVYAPVAEGQALALQRCYQMAGYDPQTVELVEAHGTATVAGDAAEFAGLKSVFKSTGGQQQWCALGSVKSQIGHTKGAAGAAGLIKSILALQQKVLPPTIKVERLNPKLDIDNSPFYINTQTRPWVRGAQHPRRASASALGFGGSNFHVTVEEYTGPGRQPPRLQLAPVEAVLINSNSIPDAIARCSTLRHEEITPAGLHHLAYTTQHAFDPAQHIRLVLLVSSAASLAAQLDKAIALLQQQTTDQFEIITADIFISGGVQADKTAVLFPGQGSQYLGMGAELAMFMPTAQAVWDRAASELAEQAPHHTVFPPPAIDDEQRQRQEQLLRQPAQAQPALGVCALANWQVLDKLGIRPDAVAGHSFGEVLALHVAGVFDEAAMLNIAATRGSLMAEAAAGTAGAMSAVLGDKAVVTQVVETVGHDLVIANDNSPQQCVISGGLESIARAEQQLQAQGLRVIRLPVASAFHSTLVADAAQPFAQFLRDIRFHKPTMPVLACSTAAAYAVTPAAMRKTLAEQLARPVRFAEQIEQLYAMGIRTFIEVGAGNVLSKLVTECLPERPHRAIACDQKNAHGALSLYRALAQLTIAGHRINWPALWDGLAVPQDPAHESKPKLSRPVGGHNLDRPYPPSAGSLHAPMDYFTHPRPTPDGQEDVTMQTTPDTTEPEATAAQGTTVNTPQNDVHHVLLAAQQQYQAAMQAMQQSMTDAHLNYLRAVQGMLGGTTDTPVQIAERQAPPQRVSPAPAMPVTPRPPAGLAAAQVVPTQVDTATIEEQPAAITTAPSAGLPNVVELFLDVVADKTGYPREVLALDMEMESGLGIDSIKRVEILAELQKQLPALAELDASQLASLATLREVVKAVEQTMSTPPAAAANPAAPPAAGSNINIVELFLDVVADKTGYPREVLALDMEMESGLGIDSIKRVEILAELQKQLPALAELDASQLAGLSTLREVVTSVEQTASAGQVVEQALVRATQPEKKTLYETQHRHILTWEAVAAPGFVSPGLTKQGVIGICGDHLGLATELADLLVNTGINAQVFNSLHALPDDLHCLICLHGLQAADSAATGITQQIAVVKELQQAADVLRRNQGLLVLLQGGHDSPWNRGLVALARTARLEWPELSTRYIACAQADPALAQTLLQELLAGGDTAEISLQSDGQRYRLVDQAQAVVAAELPLNDAAVLVVAGGGRGVTAACVIELAQQQHLRFALLGRTELVDESLACQAAEDEAGLISILSQSHSKADLLALRQQARAILASREIRHTLQQIRAAGSEAQYYCTDIQDPAAVTQSLQQIRQAWGPIHALLHAAGVLADKHIMDKTGQQLSQVMQTKLQGIETLLHATRQDPLQLIVMFSSVAARYGNVGQCDYAMANEVLNQLALQLAQQRPTCRVKSLMWGPWDGGMVTPALKKHFANMRVPLIDMQDGARWFVDELRQADDVLLVLGEGRQLSGAAPAPSQPHEFTVLVSAQRQAYLLDHSIAGKVVLPVAQIIDWFVRAAQQLDGPLADISIEDFQVLSGIKVVAFTEQAFTVTVQLNKLAADHYTAVLLDARHKACYRASIKRDDPAARPAQGFAQATSDLGPWPVDIHEAYGAQTLFHGPAFQVIHELGAMGNDGGVLQINSDADQAWWGAPFPACLALLDGCLQAAVLWGQCQLKQHSLPISIKRIHWFRQNQVQGVVDCHFAIHTHHNRLRSDMRVLDPQGQVLLTLQGVENIVYAVTSEAL